jgi:hypothetical protein
MTTRLNVIPYVNCLNCSHPNALLIPTLDGKPTGRQHQTRPGWRLRLACHECGIGSVYQGSHVRWRSLEKSDRKLFQDSCLVRVEIECEAGCPGPRTIFHTRAVTPSLETIETNGSSLTQEWELLQRIAGGFYQSLPCTNGHPISQEASRGSYAVEKGQNWWVT